MRIETCRPKPPPPSLRSAPADRHRRGRRIADDTKHRPLFPINTGCNCRRGVVEPRGARKLDRGRGDASRRWGAALRRSVSHPRFSDAAA
ncbi:hypothetical protein AAFF_G00341500 [Aldrovandia affinis]|uniref:Uncharacterized protein n=1 Tax=Aldrovandia affinis TaxID=143900 RepID=A0AAD7SLT8_9TELE|nr:hypothetical protein AAFF_G00341500 [Aldrovandia affinis]